MLFPTFCGHKLVWLIYIVYMRSVDTSIKMNSYLKIYGFCMCKIILVKRKIASHCFLVCFKYFMNLLNHAILSCHDASAVQNSVMSVALMSPCDYVWFTWCDKRWFLIKLRTLREAEICVFQRYTISILDGTLIIMRYLCGLALSILSRRQGDTSD
jgi:hypothetical protein